LLWDPGEFIQMNNTRLMRADTPFEIEYARESKSRGGGPTLIPDDRGGRVNGGIWVLRLRDTEPGISTVRKELAKRETTTESNIRDCPGLGGLSHVFYVSLPCTMSMIEPSILARKAIESVRRNPERNGVQYLRKNIEWGIVTPVTNEYRNAILSQLQCQSLEDAEARALDNE